jgi:hypothetical protein
VALIGAVQLATEGRLGFFFLEGCVAGATSPSSRLLVSFVDALDSAAATSAFSKALALVRFATHVKLHSSIPVLRNSCYHSGAQMLMKADF